jgi:hypothetical protein
VSVSLSAFAFYPGTHEWEKAVASGLIAPEAYDAPNSLDAVWERFDEGVGAVHCMKEERAAEIHRLASEILGERRLFTDLPDLTRRDESLRLASV